MNRRSMISAALAVASAPALLVGCGGSSIEGTYFGTAGDTVLVLASDGQCGYTDEYDEEEDGADPKVELEDDCSWSLSGSSLTLVGVIGFNSLSATVGDDGKLSIPDQPHWGGEIYSKK